MAKSSILQKPPILCDMSCKKGTCHDFCPELNSYVFYCSITHTGGIVGLLEQPSRWTMIYPLDQEEWVLYLANLIDIALENEKQGHLIN